MEPTQKKKNIWKLIHLSITLIVFLVIFFAPLFPAITHKKITNFIAEVNEKPYLVSSESYEDYNDLGYTQGTTTVYRLINSNSVQAAFDVFKQEEENAKKDSSVENIWQEDENFSVWVETSPFRLQNTDFWQRVETALKRPISSTQKVTLIECYLVYKNNMSLYQMITD